MKKTNLLTFSLISMMVTTTCYASQSVFLNQSSFSDAEAFENENGITQVDVNHANNDRVSHIYYNLFDINQDGLILKNNNADLIINEVVSGERSLLAGELALQGKIATVIIANPNGISCVDCSFSGTNDIKLITGRTTDKFSKEFNLTGANFNFSFMNQLTRNEFTHVNRFNKDISQKYINIISNKVVLEKGDFNAEYIRFDIGLNKFNLNYLNYYDRSGILEIRDTAELNSRYVIMEGKNSTIYNYGDINTLSLYTNVERWANCEGSSLKLNTDENLYRTAFDGRKKSKILVSDFYSGSPKGLLSIKNSDVLYDVSDSIYLDEGANIEYSNLILKADIVTISNVNLNKSIINANTKNKLIIDGNEISSTDVLLIGAKDKGKIKSMNGLAFENEKVIIFNRDKIVND